VGFKDAESIGLRVPRSWLGQDAEQFAAQHQDKLGVMHVAAGLVQTQLGGVEPQQPGEKKPANASGEASDEMSAKEKALREALSKGGFDMTGVVGKYWQQAKKSDTQLKSDYESIGKKYANQRAFRMKWLATALEEFSKTKTKKEDQGQVTENQGTFEPFDIIVDREGGEHRPQAVQAALNYTLACIKFHELGQTVGNTGTPWMSWNIMTQRWEFMYLKKTYRDWFGTSWSLAITQKTGASALEDTKAADAETNPEAEGNPEPETPQKVPPAAAKAKAKAKVKRELEGDDAETPEVMAAKRAKKELDVFFRKLKALKVDMGTAISTATDILGLISRDPDWAWAAGPASTPLKEAFATSVRANLAAN
jgi:hypothetical protein